MTEPVDNPASAASRPAGADSAPRRTWLAGERTYLAWLRTSLGALGLALAVGRLIPALINAERIPFALLGLGYAALAVLLIVLAAYRWQRVRAALAADRPIPEDAWSLWVLTFAGLVLAAATVALIVVSM